MEKPVSRQIPQQKQRQITRDLSTAGIIICRFAKDYDVYQIKISIIFRENFASL